MDFDKVANRFNDVAEEYDSQRRMFIPCYDDFYGTSVSFLSRILPKPQTILDLGAGTGLLSRYFYEKYPNARYTLVDIADQMLDIARKRFAGAENFTFAACDYTRDLPEQSFDLIGSALSIHHLEDAARESLYRNAYEKLNPGECFINLDQFIPSSALMNAPFTEFWHDYIDNSEITPEARSAQRKRSELDRENSIDETKRILSDCGYKSVECVYSYFKFGVVIAVK